MEAANREKRWHIAVCERGTVHLHYGTGSLHILGEDFFALLRELEGVARHLAGLTSAAASPGKHGIH